MDGIKKQLYLSSALHISLFVLLTIKLTLFPSEIRRSEKAVRVDLVALPDKITKLESVVKPQAKKEAPAKKEQPKPAAKPEVKKEVPKAKTISLEKKKKDLSKKQNNALQRLRARQKQASALKKIQDKIRKQETIAKGNQLSKGTTNGAILKLQQEAYFDQFDSHIKGYWNLPGWLANKGLQAIFMVKFNSEGALVGLDLIRPSGDEIFDQKARESIEKASPYPKPPANLTSIFRNQGIELRFPE